MIEVQPATEVNAKPASTGARVRGGGFCCELRRAGLQLFGEDSTDKNTRTIGTREERKLERGAGVAEVIGVGVPPQTPQGAVPIPMPVLNTSGMLGTDLSGAESEPGKGNSGETVQPSERALRQREMPALQFSRTGQRYRCADGSIGKFTSGTRPTAGGAGPEAVSKEPFEKEFVSVKAPTGLREVEGPKASGPDDVSEHLVSQAADSGRQAETEATKTLGETLSDLARSEAMNDAALPQSQGSPDLQGKAMRRQDTSSTTDVIVQPSREPFERTLLQTSGVPEGYGPVERGTDPTVLREAKRSSQPGGIKDVNNADARLRGEVAGQIGAKDIVPPPSTTQGTSADAQLADVQPRIEETEVSATSETAPSRASDLRGAKSRELRRSDARRVHSGVTGDLDCSRPSLMSDKGKEIPAAGVNPEPTGSARTQEVHAAQDHAPVARQGKGQPIGSAQEIRPDQRTGEPAHSPSWVSRPSPLSTADLAKQLKEAEVRIGFRTRQSGNVEIHAVVRDGQTEAVVSVQNREVRSALIAELPTLRNALENQQVDLGRLNVVEHQLGGSFEGAADKGRGGSTAHGSDERTGGANVAPKDECESLAGSATGLSVHA